ncbi:MULTISPECIES: hypothetical protein [Legionella]|uniref:Uncharacterized protein n=1 Tax=Legionella drozanskii LLAP-1 TaxID=1212489 RepID=A0A0W0SWM6_9GAMM|nr:MULTISPECIES: hypothetical protein [Legionella]KTC87713.1 hypothetical protein Ldro_1332 [Legionella drozanskii LLAP-1]PJE16246.1 MAG: hypothetical protein CK430_03440 [Legionella sp.]
MKFKSLILASCLGLFSSAYADHSHSYPQTNNTPSAKSDLTKGATYPGYCAIEIVNNSFDGVWVYGTFEDGTSLKSFYIPRYDTPHVIHLDHYDYRYGYTFCHHGMDIYIEDYRGRGIYNEYTTDGTTIEIRPSFNNQLKAEVKKK